MTEQDGHEIERRLGALAEEPVEIPSAASVYWRAQAWETLDQARRRRREQLRPLRHFQQAIGGGIIAAGTGAFLWPLLTAAPPTTTLVLAPTLLLLAAVGASLVVEDI